MRSTATRGDVILRHRRAVFSPGGIAVQVILAAGALTMVLPFIWMLSTSFKPPAEVISWPPRFIPLHPTVKNYVDAMKAAPFFRFFINSFLVSGISTLSILLTSSFSGFLFAKYRFPGRDIIFIAILATAMVPFQSYMIPFYLFMRDLGWLSTYQGLVAPLLIMSFGIFFMRQNILSIPDELMDAARIDGCSEFGIYTKIILPLSKAALSALSIFAFRNAWSDFIWPLLITNDINLYTMELGLGMFQHRFTVDYGCITAGSVISVAPILVVFAVFRRNIIEGITLTGLKG
ncbi:MAG TPA: carbohydrate ABC transporter permease [Firmicutes bacterium]|nr:carbohydrate ABC transporter permease [Bacillota bacterium]